MKTVLKRFSLLFILVAVSSMIAYKAIYGLKPLPIIQPSDINPKLVDQSVQGVLKNHTIGNFSLIDQEGKTVTPSDFENHIYVADFIFTTCPGICPIMTANLSQVHQAFIDQPLIKFISHSVTPIQDSIPVLKAFAEKYGIVNNQKWHFVTGDKKHIYDLARKHYFAATTEGDGGEDDFVHSENLILIDTHQQIRGIYDGTSFDDIDRLKNDIETLIEETESEKE